MSNQAILASFEGGSKGTKKGVIGDAKKTQQAKLDRQQKIISRFEGVPEKEKKGLLDKAQGVVSTPGRLLLKGMAAARYVPGTVAALSKEGSDLVMGGKGTKGKLDQRGKTSEKASWDDLWQEIKSGEGFGSYIDSGNKWVDRIAGFTLDVVADPLTYVGGTGVIAKAGRAGAAAKVLEKGAAKGFTEKFGQEAIERVATKLGAKGGAGLNKADRIIAEEILGEKVGGVMLRVPGTRTASRITKNAATEKSVRIVPAGATSAVFNAPGVSKVVGLPGQLATKAADLGLSGETGKAKALVRSGDVTLAPKGIAAIASRSVGHAQARGWLEEAQKGLAGNEGFKGPDALQNMQNHFLEQTDRLRTKVREAVRDMGIPEPERFDIDLDALHEKLAARLEKAVADGKDPREVLALTLNKASKDGQDAIAKAFLIKSGVTESVPTVAQINATKEAAGLGVKEAKAEHRVLSAEAKLADDALKKAESWQKTAAGKTTGAQRRAGKQATKNREQLDKLIADTQAKLGGVYEGLSTNAEKARAAARANHVAVEAAADQARDKLTTVEQKIVAAEARGAAEAGGQAEKIAAQRAKVEAQHAQVTERLKRVEKGGVAHAELTARAKRLKDQINAVKAAERKAATKATRATGVPGFPATQKTLKALRAEQAQLERVLDAAAVYSAAAPKTLDSVWELGLESTQAERRALMSERDRLAKIEHGVLTVRNAAAPDPAAIRQKADEMGRFAYSIRNADPERARELGRQANDLAKHAGELERDFDSLAGIDLSDADASLAALRDEYDAALARAKASGDDVVSVERSAKYLQQHAGDATREIADAAGTWELADGEYVRDPRVADAIKKMIDTKGLDDYIKSYDKIMGLWKASALMSPGFQIRNFMGAVFNNWLADVRPSSYLRYRNMMKKGAKGFEMTERDQLIYNLIKKSYLNEQGQAVHEVLDTMGMGFLSRKTKGWVPETGPLGRAAAPFRTATQVGGSATKRVEAAARGTLALDVLDKTLDATGSNFEEALAEAHRMVARYHFDYDDLTSLEKNGLKRVIPFYTWTRKNLPLQIENMIRQPERYQRWMKVQRNLGIGVPDVGVIPGYYTDDQRAQTPWAGGKGFIKPDLPYMNVFDQLTSPAEWASSATPFIKVPLESWGGKTFFGDLPMRDELKEQTGAMAPVTKLLTLPVVQQLSNAVGIKVKTSATGEPMMSDKDVKTLGSVLPLVSRLARIAPGGEDNGGSKALAGRLSFFGVGYGELTDNAQAGELYKRNKEVKEAIDRLVERGYISPAALKKIKSAQSTSKSKGRSGRSSRSGRTGRTARGAA